MREIVLDNVSVEYPCGRRNVTKALTDLSLCIRPGSFVSVVGSNASGKTTLLNLISGRVRPTHGDVWFDGIKVTNVPEYLRHRTVAMVYQTPSWGCVEAMTVEENVALALSKRDRLSLGRALGRGTKARVKGILEDYGFGLAEKARSRVDELSGGLKQVLSLIMAASSAPDILLLDEHTASLDVENAQTVAAVTQRIAEQARATVIMVSHKIEDAVAVGNRLLVLKNGSVVLDVSEREKGMVSVDAILKLLW